MSHQKIETVGSTSDKLKLALAVIIIAAGIVAYSVLENEPTITRVGIFIGSVVLAAIVAWFSQTGKRTIAFSREAYNETRRVIWPNRKETTRMTAIVFAFVIAMGILLWLADKILSWVIYGLLLGWN